MMRYATVERVGLCRAVAVAAILASACSSSADFVVASGWDLFQTEPGTELLGISLTGLPLEEFDFGTGPEYTGNTDTIVRRLGDSDSGGSPGPAAPIDIELVALQLQSVTPIDLGAGLGIHGVTLQSDRGRHVTDPASGPASAGSMTLTFDGDHVSSPDAPVGGGTFDSLINVYFDVRIGGVGGPIIYSDVLPLEATDALWLHEPNMGALLIPGVNEQLNGFSRHRDFHAAPFVEAKPDTAAHVVAPARIDVPPPWDRQDQQAVVLDLEFTQSNPFVLPDGAATNLSHAEGGGANTQAWVGGATFGQAAWDQGDGDGGWLFNQENLITIDLDNIVDFEPVKFVRVQIMYSSSLPGTPPPSTDAWWGQDNEVGTDLQIDLVDVIQHGDNVIEELWTIQPNPDFERFDVVVPLGVYIDQIVVDTISIPWPNFLGDLNGDGFVGQDDLDVVLGAWGTSPPSDPRADPSGDNFVGQDDLDTVLGDWGLGTPPPPVPEPATLSLLALASLAMMRRKRK